MAHLNRTNFVYSAIITSFLITGIAFAATITAPEIPRFGDNGADNVITGAIGAGERNTFSMIFNFTTGVPLTVGDTLYLLNGTDALAANLTSSISHVVTQAEINQKSLNFTTSDLNGLSDGNYIFRGQWVDTVGDGDAGTQGNEAGTLTLDSDITPTVTITPTPSTPSGSKTSLSFALEFSEPVTGLTSGDLTIDFNGGGFGAVGGTFSLIDADSATYTLSAGELSTIEDGTPSETVSLKLTGSGNAVEDTNGNDVADTTSVWTFDASLVSGSSGGSGCTDCEAPTLGIDKNGRRHVSDGFTYNGYSVDAERFFTPYPLITANVGKTNVAAFKIYENQGTQNIRHFTLAFGMDNGDIISDSTAKIELDIDFDGTETVTVTDPENVLDKIKVTTSTVSCMDDSNTECLGISIQHRFRAPLDFNIVATDVWDTKRNSWQNYFNHGIEVVGESLNPPKEYDGIDKRQHYHLTETSKTTSIDEFGNSWSLEYGLWVKDYVKSERIHDTSSIMTRMHSDFTDYKNIQADLASNIMSAYYRTSINYEESFAEINNIFAYEYPETFDSKLDNQEIQKNMVIQAEKAQKIMNYLLDPLLYR